MQEMWTAIHRLLNEEGRPRSIRQAVARTSAHARRAPEDSSGLRQHARPLVSRRPAALREGTVGDRGRPVHGLRASLGRERSTPVPFRRRLPDASEPSVSEGPSRGAGRAPLDDSHAAGGPSFARRRRSESSRAGEASGGKSTCGLPRGRGRGRASSSSHCASAASSAGPGPAGLLGFISAHAPARRVPCAALSYEIPSLLAHLSDAALFGALSARFLHLPHGALFGAAGASKPVKSLVSLPGNGRI